MPALLGVLLLASGCNVIGAAAYVIGPPAVEPEYVPAQEPMLVLAENYGNPTSASLAAEQLERMVIEELKLHAIAPIAPDSDRVYELRVAEPQRFRGMSVAALGRLAGAAQVLYLNLQVDSSDIAPGAHMLKGQASASVKIVDVATGDTLWPLDMAGGYPVAYETRFTRAGEAVNASTIQRGAQAGLTDRIVKLFYKYRPDDEPIE
jgi:hypothetical protein